MPQALYPLLLLACPLGMALMMWWMTRGKHGKQSRSAAPHTAPATQAEIEDLRKEIRELRARQAERFSKTPGN
ncbi:hypothetical protein [Streptomyces werraensis]|uniref:hypothetical protein n=1 Tax=Streptomyces werraensis TaxID=68284 RepID=UPI0033A8B3D3